MQQRGSDQGLDVALFLALSVLCKASHDLQGNSGPMPWIGRGVDRWLLGYHKGGDD